MNARGLLSLCALSAGLAIAGCAAQSFQPIFKTPSRPEPDQIARELAAIKPRVEAHVVVAIASEPQRLVAWDLSALSKGALWEHPVDAKSIPLIAGNRVVMHEGDAITVRDLATGVVLTTLGEGARLVGADGEGDAVVIALAHEGESTEKGTIAYVQGSRVRWTEDLNLAVGTPALVRGYVLVPWATHRLSVLDVQDGAELARWHFNGTVLGHARVEQSGVYVGQLGLMRLKGELLDVKAEDVRLIAPVPRPLPGQPPLLLDGYAPAPEPTNAQRQVHVDFRVGDNDAIQGDAFYARFYRLVFALAPGEDRVRSVHVLPRDVVGAEVVHDGLLVTDEGGTLRYLGRDGQAQVVAELGKTLIVSTIRAATWAPAAPAPAAPAVVPSLDAQLCAAATLDDSRIAAGRVYAIERLALTQSGEVTAELIEMCIHAASPESVRRMACDRLEGRDNGGDAILAALRAAPTGQAQASRARTSALAKAAAHMQLRPAAPLLLPHVLDIRTEPSELAVVITALAELGHQPAVAVIDRFLRLHHGEPEGSEVAPALIAATTALSTLRAKPQRDTLLFVSADGLTAGPLRKAAQEALLALDAPPVKAAASADAAAVAVAATAAPAEPAPPPPDARPRYLSAELVAAALRPVHAKLVACLKALPDAPKVARIAMVIGARGALERAFVTPQAMQACAEPLVRATRFPETQGGRQNIAHIVRSPQAKKADARPIKKAP